MGDTVNIPLPKWIWSAGATRFKSEGGNESEEYFSFWETPRMLSILRGFFDAFREEFGADAGNVPELIASLGPAGEMHYPSYHSHDRDLPFARYPERGSLQASSDSARESFRQAMFAKYGSLAGIATAWEKPWITIADVHPPSTTAEVSRSLLANNGVFSAYGQDFFDWYRASLLAHSQALGSTMLNAFEAGPFAHAAVGFKIPGVHWAMDTRLAELTSGLISSRQPESGIEWKDPARGMGYRAVFEMLRTLQSNHPRQPISVYFTAGMTPNGDGQLPVEKSRAEDLARAILTLANESGIRLGLENALDGDLLNPGRVELLKRVMRENNYANITFLRLDDVVSSPLVQQALPEIRHDPSPFADCDATLTQAAAWRRQK